MARQFRRRAQLWLQSILCICLSSCCIPSSSKSIWYYRDTQEWMQQTRSKHWQNTHTEMPGFPERIRVADISSYPVDRILDMSHPQYGVVIFVACALPTDSTLLALIRYFSKISIFMWCTPHEFCHSLLRNIFGQDQGR